MLKNHLLQREEKGSRVVAYIFAILLYGLQKSTLIRRLKTQGFGNIRFYLSSFDQHSVAARCMANATKNLPGPSLDGTYLPCFDHLCGSPGSAWWLIQRAVCMVLAVAMVCYQSQK